MKQQHYKNHRQLVLSWHIVTALLILALIAGAFRNLFVAEEDNIYDASLIALGSLVLLFIYLHARKFALKAQDRAIRAEESLRHFLVTGKPIDQRLNLDQVIALRFASDEELPALARLAADQGLKGTAIKKLIRKWRPDTHRV